MSPDLVKIRKRFFATARSMGYDPVFVKERAKQYYGGVSSFTKLTYSQIKNLVDKMDKIKKSDDRRKTTAIQR